MWLTLAAIGFQAGFLARLTWWELGWNIVEPITYFATSTMFIASFSYYLYTNEVVFAYTFQIVNSSVKHISK